MVNEQNRQHALLKKLLRDKLGVCYAEHKKKWMKMSPEDLIANCEEVAAITRFSIVLIPSLGWERAEYLLRFKDPLAVVTGEWLAQNGTSALKYDYDIDFFIQDLMSKDTLKHEYEMEP